MLPRSSDKTVNWEKDDNVHRARISLIESLMDFETYELNLSVFWSNGVLEYWSHVEFGMEIDTIFYAMLYL